MTPRTYGRRCSCALELARDESGTQSCGCGWSTRPTVHDWLFELNLGSLSQSFDVVEIAFKGGRADFFQNTQAIELRPGDVVIVQADRGIDIGTVHLLGDMVRVRLRTLGLDADSSFPEILRLASTEDIVRLKEVRASEQNDLETAEIHIEKLGLSMTLVDMEWQFDCSKVTFYFTADRRVDFRELVRKLARTFRARVELRQIGARDQAASVGGLGVCGRELCCSTWLRSFAHVSTDAAKNQNITLSPARVSGQCGRLKCCLNYELQRYVKKSNGAVDSPSE